MLSDTLDSSCWLFIEQKHDTKTNWKTLETRESSKNYKTAELTFISSKNVLSTLNCLHIVTETLQSTLIKQFNLKKTLYKAEKQ